jgi:hypothetical protein
VLVAWEKGQFDLPAWPEQRPQDTAMFPATVWPLLLYGTFACDPPRDEFICAAGL